MSARYGAAFFGLPKEFLQSVRELRPARSALALALAWIQVITLVLIARFAIADAYRWMAYPLVVFAIAGRIGLFLQLLHEAAHNVLFRAPRWNAFTAKWLLGYPWGVDAEGYVHGHMKHHAYVGTDKDPVSDTEKYRAVDATKFQLYLLFLKDLVGITAVSVFLAYKSNGDSFSEKKKEQRSQRVAKLGHLVLVQLVILGMLFQFDIAEYILFWLFPAAGPHMFLMRIRGIAEHGLAKQLGKTPEDLSQGILYTRSFLCTGSTYPFRPIVWLEKFLIGSLSVHYHHEHHLFPDVPFYHLEKVHRRICAQVAALNPDVYETGYFTAAFRTLGQFPKKRRLSKQANFASRLGSQ